MSNKTMSHKTFHYRIYPTKKQETTLTHWLQLLCETYNAALQERRDAYRMAGKSIGFSHQCAELPECRHMRPDLAEVPSQVLQDAVKRVDLAFDRFFQRCASGEKPGYPRYKSHVRYDSMTFKQYGNSFDVAASAQKNRGTLVLAKLGQVKMVMHRPLAGTPKTAIVKRTPTGKWFVSISCEDVPKGNVPQSDKEVGIDVGLKTFAYLSDGTSLENPRFFRQEEKNLAKAQRKRDKAPKQSQERKKLKKRVARVHERTKHRRKNFAHQHSRKIVNTCNLIAVEALIVRNMVKNPKLSASIADAAWSQFFAFLCSKAEEAGRTVVKVNPAYTSQRCSCCGHVQEMPLSVRIYECPNCGLVIDRDHNGSKNILDEGLKAVGRHSRVIPEAPGL
ncbi:transposase [Ktedonobacter sp. SOSP1-85]|nr:transposase [Ktedonobacter sp. SOSP1-85]